MAGPEIRGTVLAGGKPVGGAYVRVLGPSGEFVAEEYTKDEGQFRFYVAPGRWTVEVRAIGKAPVTRSFEVDSGEHEIHVDVTLA